MIFRDLDPLETAEFWDWAMRNDPPDLADWELYHPVCRAAWRARGIHPLSSKSAETHEEKTP